MFAPRLDPPVTEIRSDLSVFLIVILKNCPLRFSHNFTVLS